MCIDETGQHRNRPATGGNVAVAVYSRLDLLGDSYVCESILHGAFEAAPREPRRVAVARVWLVANQRGRLADHHTPCDRGSFTRGQETSRAAEGHTPISV